MQARDIADYLERITDKLAETGGTLTQPPQIDVDYDLRVGKLDFSQTFANGYRLEVTLVAIGPATFPDWLDYRFHLMDDQHRCVFRYDNAAHHGSIYFPHHKHVGPAESVVASPRPSVAELVRETRSSVYGSSQ